MVYHSEVRLGGSPSSQDARYSGPCDETIAAIATPQGRGGVGIIRISGSCVSSVIQALLHRDTLKSRYATFCSFFSSDDQVIDEGIALFFPGPHSFTGEDVLELQGHGSPVVLDRLLEEIQNTNPNFIRLAKPGEFLERAFLNDRIDLVRAEAVADLINATSRQAAQSAVRSLQGQFSSHIQALLSLLVALRSYVEACLDFSNEEVGPKARVDIQTLLNQLLGQLGHMEHQVEQGVRLQEGVKIVLMGETNVGKSSLLNSLSGEDRAIVTAVPGTTRDTLEQTVSMQGMHVCLVDTAGLRDSEDPIESIGIERAQQAIKQAHHVVLVVDVSRLKSLTVSIEDVFATVRPYLDVANLMKRFTVVFNKMDVATCEKPAALTDRCFYVSAKTGEGLDALRQHLFKVVGWHTSSEGGYIARRRHLEALEKTKTHLLSAFRLFSEIKDISELVAEELTLAQRALSEITGVFHPEDLLDRIFRTFCIGK